MIMIIIVIIIITIIIVAVVSGSSMSSLGSNAQGLGSLISSTISLYLPVATRSSFQGTEMTCNVASTDPSVMP